LASCFILTFSWQFILESLEINYFPSLGFHLVAVSLMCSRLWQSIALKGPCFYVMDNHKLNIIAVYGEEILPAIRH
jgi:hypothetical protein